jgi:hypothetical protein
MRIGGAMFFTDYSMSPTELKRIPVILKRSLRERNNLRIRLGLVVG